MKITLVLDSAVAAMLKRQRKQRRASVRQIVNDALREGLLPVAARPKLPGPFRTSVASLGRCYVANLDNLAEVFESTSEKP